MRWYLTCGRGEGSTELNAFDAALLQAGLGNVNNIKLSSILPPRAQELRGKIPHNELHYNHESGSKVYSAQADIRCSFKGFQIAAAIAVGIPEDPDLPGLIMENHCRGGQAECEAQVVDMVREGMALRGWPIKEVRSIAVEATCKDKCVAAFAALVEIDDD